MDIILMNYHMPHMHKSLHSVYDTEIVSTTAVGMNRARGSDASYSRTVKNTMHYKSKLLVNTMK